MKKNGSIILSILLFVSVLGNAYFFYDHHQSENNQLDKMNKLQHEKKQMEENLKKQKEEIQTQLNEAQKTLEDFRLSMVEESSNSEKKIAYLTFDDGPSHNTTRNLDTLKKNGIKATFFVNGHPGKENEFLYQRIVNEGHAIGNHTYSHDYAKIYRSVSAYKEDMKQLDDYIFSLTGVRSKLVRFPGGSNNQVSYSYGGKTITKQIAIDLNLNGYHYYDWNVDSTDASAIKQNKNTIVNNVLQQSKNKKKVIILMHDSAVKTTTADALPEIIKGLKQQGFEFRSLHTYSYNNQFLDTKAAS